MVRGVVVVVAAFAVVLVDTALGTVEVRGRVRPDVLHAAINAAHTAATVRWPISLPAPVAIDAPRARFISHLPW
jgi:hypothetical protein